MEEKTMDLAEFCFAELSEPKVKFSDYDVTIAGRRGAGKSTLAIEFFKNECCVVDVEDGNKQLKGVYKVVPKSWKELKQLQRTWAKAIKAGHKPPFSVLLFDTQTKLALMCDEYVLNTNGWEDFTQGSDGVNRWNARKSEYDTTMNGFKNLGFKIVYICHGKDKEIRLRGQESYKQFVPDVGASFDYAVLGAVDFVFYLEKTRITGKDGNPKEVRRLILQNDLDYDVKCRFPELPDEIIYEEAKDGVKEFFKSWEHAVNGADYDDEEDTAPMEFAPKIESDDLGTLAEVPAAPKVSLEDAKDMAIEVRDALMASMDKPEVVSLLKDALGTPNISKCDDVDKLMKFVETYK